MPDLKPNIFHKLPAWAWLSQYNSVKFKSDALASLIVVAMLVPQGMAYAMLAGLPPIMGLYASILPMLVYAMLGGSTTLSIGPVAIISMMTFATLHPLFEVGFCGQLECLCLQSQYSYCHYWTYRIRKSPKVHSQAFSSSTQRIIRIESERTSRKNSSASWTWQ